MCFYIPLSSLSSLSFLCQLPRHNLIYLVLKVGICLQSVYIGSTSNIPTHFSRHSGIPMSRWCLNLPVFLIINPTLDSSWHAWLDFDPQNELPWWRSFPLEMVRKDKGRAIARQHAFRSFHRLYHHPFFWNPHLVTADFNSYTVFFHRFKSYTHICCSG